MRTIAGPYRARLIAKAAGRTRIVRHCEIQKSRFGIGVGTVVMLINAALLSGYTFGCHSWRHLVGGNMDCMTCDGHVTTRHRPWKSSTWFNARHMAFAWVSLVWVAFTDFYIHLVSSGAIRDLHTWQAGGRLPRRSSPHARP